MRLEHPGPERQAPLLVVPVPELPRLRPGSGSRLAQGFAARQLAAAMAPRSEPGSLCPWLASRVCPLPLKYLFVEAEKPEPPGSALPAGLPPPALTHSLRLAR